MRSPRADRYTRSEVLAAGAALVAAGTAGRLARGLAWEDDAQAATDATVQHFVSRRDLQPPVVTVLRRTEAASPGLLFVAPSSGPGQRGAMIFDDTGRLVWFHPVPHKTTVTDFKVQQYRGKPVLTWWEGKVVAGLGRGEWVVADPSYRELFRFSAADRGDGDLHEFQLTPEGTALVTYNETTVRDLSSVGGSSHGRVVDGIAQELALASGRVLWEWRSLDHVPVEETAIREKPGPRFDYFHINSIDIDADGDFIVSARNTWAAYKVHRRTGGVLWRLGGKRSDFAFGPGARFYWQHDVRHHANGIVSVFDNAAAPAKEPRSRGLVLSLDTKRKHVSLVHAYTHRPENVLSHYMGNIQLLPDGNAFVGWGGAPYVTEFARGGAIVFDARLPKGGQSYRAFRFPWVGTPAAPPALAAAKGVLHASWNGATEVASWQLLEGGSAGDLKPGATVARTGFETVLKPSVGTRRVAVAALDRSGKELGRSAVVSV